MKHIWYIDENKIELHEGYVSNDYRTYFNENSNIPIWDQEFGESLTSSKLEDIFDNKETAINIYKGMIGIERCKIHNKIEELKKYDESLFEKLLNIE